MVFNDLTIELWNGLYEKKVFIRSLIQNDSSARFSVEGPATVCLERGDNEMNTHPYPSRGLYKRMSENNIGSVHF